MTTEKATEIPCPNCGEVFENTPKGRASRARHIRIEHPEATARGKTEKETSEYFEMLPPLAQRFHEALERSIPKNLSKVRSLVDTFTRNTDTLGQNRHTFRSWITRHGLTQDQIAMVQEELSA